MSSDYSELFSIFSYFHPQVPPVDFYTSIFPDNEVSGTFASDYSSPNAVYLHEGLSGSLHRRIMLRDTWPSDFDTFVHDSSFAICSGLSYRGRTNKLAHAQRMHALIIDLDGVGPDEYDAISVLECYPPEQIRSILTPTYTALSGTGLHLYYVFHEPIDLFPNIKIQLKALKYDLTHRFWNPTVTSSEDEVQYQSINQAFRMVGSINSKHGNRVVAFQTGEKVTIDQLNAYVDDKSHMVDLSKPFRPSQMTREEAKEAYPEWYQRVVVDGIQSHRKWDIKGKQGYALYDWWRNHVTSIEGGHRYFYLMCLAVYASKCDVPFSKLKRDMEEDFLILQRVNHSNTLTRRDIDSALEMYSRDFYNFTIADIEKLTDVRIERNKRNYRKQKDHVKLMNLIRDELNQNTTWNRVGNGRKPKKDIVKAWRAKNPQGRKIDCERETGLSRPTVLKWWDA